MLSIHSTVGDPNMKTLLDLTLIQSQGMDGEWNGYQIEIGGPVTKLQNNLKN